MSIREPCPQRSETAVNRLFQYLRYALRQLHRNPGFALAVVVTLALELG